MNESMPEARGSPLPADFVCPACGYDLSGAMVERCSECGAHTDGVTTRADWRRRRFMRWAPFVIGGGWGLALASIFAFAFHEKAEFGEIVLGLLLMLGPGVLGGVIATSRSPQSQISAAWHAWLVWLAFLQAPIVLSVGTVFLLVFLRASGIGSMETLVILSVWLAVILCAGRFVSNGVARLSGVEFRTGGKRSFSIGTLVALGPTLFFVAYLIAESLRRYPFRW